MVGFKLQFLMFPVTISMYFLNVMYRQPHRHNYTYSYMYCSFGVFSLMLSACRPNFAEVARIA